MSYSIEDILDIAQLKLHGGKESDLKYNPLFPAQAFMILSFYVGLAVTLSLKGAQFDYQLVNGFLRRSSIRAAFNYHIKRANPCMCSHATVA
jgi:hypothetical protein